MIFNTTKEQVDFVNLIIKLLEENKSRRQDIFHRAEGVLYNTEDVIENILWDYTLIRCCLMDYVGEERKEMYKKVRRIRKIVKSNI